MCGGKGGGGEGGPLFINEDFSLVTASQAQRLFHALLNQAGLSSLIKSVSWHSFRISLATRLGRAGCPPEKIQALCRWQSPESLLIYRRLGLEDHKEWIEQAAYRAEFDVGSRPTVCIESTSGLLALTKDAPQEEAQSPALAPPPQSVPTPPAQLTMRNAVGRSVLVPILPGWEHYSCTENDGQGWSARIVATRARQCVSVRFLHATDDEGRRYPDHTLPLNVLRVLPL